MPPVIGFFGAIVSGITSALTAAGLGGLVSFASLGAFLASPIGSLIIGLGISLVSSLFVKRPSAPSIEAGKVNVRIPEPERWLVAGEVRQGGGVLFAEFDALGNFWYLVVHADSVLTNTLKRYLDDIEVTVDIDGNVTTNEFCLNTSLEAYTGVGTKVPYYQIWTRTHSETNPVPPSVSELINAFPGRWTSDHRLTGTTYSVIKIKAIRAADRYKIFRWRGPVGVGEPAFSIVGEWTRLYKPSGGISSDDTTQYGYSKNTVFIWAWFRTHRYGRNKPSSSINWEKVQEQAALCDEIITGIQGSQKRYECGIAIPESKERSTAEQEILIAADAQLVFDDDGKCWPRVGYYYTPTLALTRNRDIVAMESVEAQNGESETQGVIVQYIDPAAKYTSQPSAAWLNPLYYVVGQTPKFLKINALAIQNHNQAMRLAKSLGMRSQSAHKLLPTVGLRGLKARKERIINLQYDNTFAGDYEIVTPVEVNDVGIFCGFGIVPIDADRFRLLPGEEKPKPVFTEAVDTSLPALPTNVIVTYNADLNRIEATFAAPIRQDVTYQFQYSKNATAGSDQWFIMAVDMIELLAYSSEITPNTKYYVRYKSSSIGGKSSEWSDPPIEINTITDPTPPQALSSFSVVGGMGNATFSFATVSGDTHLHHIAVYRVPTGVTLNKSVHPRIQIAAAPGTSFAYVDGDATIANLWPDPDFTGIAGLTYQAGWSRDAVNNEADHATGAESGMIYTFDPVDNVVYRYGFQINGQSVAGTGVTPYFISAPNIVGPAVSGVTTHLGTLTPSSTSVNFSLRASTWVGSIKKVVLFRQTGACCPQGKFDYYAFPENISSVEGPQAGPVSNVVVY
jgi:hypothetical protein